MKIKIERTFRLVLGLSFLPERMRRWLFDTGTRVMEVFNALCFAIWGWVLLVDGRMLETAHYRGFAVFEAVFGRHAWAGAFLACSGFAVGGLVCKAGRCRILGGYALLLGALTWTLLALGFARAFPPLNTSVMIYSGLSLLCFLSGEHVMYTVRQSTPPPSRPRNNNNKNGGAKCGSPS